jgi:hypothetical protein
MSNSHGRPDAVYESHATWRDGFLGYVVSGGAPSPSLTLTLAPFATKGYVAEAQELVYVDQPLPSQGHTLTQGAGTYYLGLARNTTSTIAGWGRWAGTHYVTYFGTPASLLADGVMPLCRLTVSATAITAVDAQPFSVALRTTRGLAISADPLAPTVGSALPPNLGLYVQPSMICDPPTFTVNSATHRVGIGTTNPTQLLHVAGAFGVDGTSTLVGPVVFGDAAATRTNLGLLDTITRVETLAWVARGAVDGGYRDPLLWVDGQDTAMYTFWRVPAAYVPSGNVTFSFFRRDSVGAGQAVMEYAVTRYNIGFGPTTLVGNTPANFAPGNLLTQQLNITVPMATVVAGNVLMTYLRRLGADGADNIAGPVSMDGVVISFPAQRNTP